MREAGLPDLLIEVTWAPMLRAFSHTLVPTKPLPPNTRMCGGEGGGGGEEEEEEEDGASEEKVRLVGVDWNLDVDGANNVNMDAHVEAAMDEEPSLNTSVITF